MVLDLRVLEIYLVLINVLILILGILFENNEEVNLFEILKIIFIYCFIMFKFFLRYCGGRIKLGEYVKIGLRCGINFVFIGNFLIIIGIIIEIDKKMIKELGYEI